MHFSLRNFPVLYAVLCSAYVKDVYVISDLHAGSWLGGPSLALLNRFLLDLNETTPGRLVLNGDIVDSCTGREFDLDPYTIDEIYSLDKVSELASRVNVLTQLGWDVDYLFGNHEFNSTSSIVKANFGSSVEVYDNETSTMVLLSGDSSVNRTIAFYHGHDTNDNFLQVPNDVEYLFSRQQGWKAEDESMKEIWGRIIPILPQLYKEYMTHAIQQYEEEDTRWKDPFLLFIYIGFVMFRSDLMTPDEPCKLEEETEKFTFRTPDPEDWSAMIDVNPFLAAEHSRDAAGSTTSGFLDGWFNILFTHYTYLPEWHDPYECPICVINPFGGWAAVSDDLSGHAMKMSSSLNADMVVLSHTHVSALDYLQNTNGETFLYANTGAMFKKQPTYLKISHEDNVATIYGADVEKGLGHNSWKPISSMALPCS